MPFQVVESVLSHERHAQIGVAPRTTSVRRELASCVCVELCARAMRVRRLSNVQNKMCV